MANRVSQTSKEIAGTAQDPLTRVTQATAEVLSGGGNNNVRITQTTAEILSGGGNNNVRLTQTNVEVLVWWTSKLLWNLVQVGEGDVPAPTVLLQTPPPPPVFYFYPTGGARVLKYKPKEGEADRQLKRLQRLWEDYARAAVGGYPSLKGLGRISNGIRWLSLGRQRKPWFRQGSIVTPAPGAGTVAVVSYEVPEGYYGWVSGFWWAYTGTGFVEGGGDIEWRLRVADNYPDGYGRVLFQMGTATDPLTVTGMLPLRSRQSVEVAVLVTNNSGGIQIGSSYILAGLAGWLYEPEVRDGGVRW